MRVFDARFPPAENDGFLPARDAAQRAQTASRRLVREPCR